MNIGVEEVQFGRYVDERRRMQLDADLKVVRDERERLKLEMVRRKEKMKVEREVLCKENRRKMEEFESVWEKDRERNKIFLEKSSEYERNLKEFYRVGHHKKSDAVTIAKSTYFQFARATLPSWMVAVERRNVQRLREMEYSLLHLDERRQKASVAFKKELELKQQLAEKKRLLQVASEREKRETIERELFRQQIAQEDERTEQMAGFYGSQAKEQWKELVKHDMRKENMKHNSEIEKGIQQTLSDIYFINSGIDESNYINSNEKETQRIAKPSITNYTGSSSSLRKVNNSNYNDFDNVINHNHNHNHNGNDIGEFDENNIVGFDEDDENEVAKKKVIFPKFSSNLNHSAAVSKEKFAAGKDKIESSSTSTKKIVHFDNSDNIKIAPTQAIVTSINNNKKRDEGEDEDDEFNHDILSTNSNLALNSMSNNGNHNNNKEEGDEEGDEEDDDDDSEPIVIPSSILDMTSPESSFSDSILAKKITESSSSSSSLAAANNPNNVKSKPHYNPEDSDEEDDEDGRKDFNFGLPASSQFIKPSSFKPAASVSNRSASNSSNSKMTDSKGKSMILSEFEDDDNELLLL